MHLIIDIGNSSAKVALFEGHNPVKEIQTKHEELPALLASFSKDERITRAIVSSVIPIDESTEQAINKLPFTVLRMSAKLRMPFSIAYKTPETLGADRLAAVAEAYMQYPGNDLLIIDVGTAITYDLITSKGVYLGGNISPGIAMRFKALHHFTGKLPLVSEEGERVEMGDTTENALREGVLQGVSYEIEGYIHTCKNKYPHLLVFLTGGGAKFLDNQTKSRTFADSLLVLKGLNRILTLNDENT